MDESNVVCMQCGDDMSDTPFCNKCGGAMAIEEQPPDVGRSASSELLCAKTKAKQFIDENVWDGEDRIGAFGDSARFTPNELQELVFELLDFIST